jgi:hypothetical protein
MRLRNILCLIVILKPELFQFLWCPIVRKCGAVKFSAAPKHYFIWAV